MQIINHTYAKTLLIIAVLGTIFSCSKEQNSSQLDDTIFVRHKDADMPAYIHGNASENLFLIMLHGGPGGIGLDYRGQAFDKFEDELAVVYFDQRGSGMAQGSYSEDGISIDIMAEDVLALVKVLKTKYGNDARFFLMGHSWGGTLGPATLLKDQSDFLGWINVDGAHNTKSMYTEYISNFRRVASEQIAAENEIEYWNEIIDFTNGVAATYNKNDMRTLNSESFAAENKLQNSGLITKPVSSDYNTILNYNLLTLFWNMWNTQSILDEDLFKTSDFTAQLSEITIPSLVLWGKHDMVVPIKFAQESFDNLGSYQKRQVIFEKSGHSPMATEPDLFAKEVISFINENR